MDSFGTRSPDVFDRSAIDCFDLKTGKAKLVPPTPPPPPPSPEDTLSQSTIFRTENVVEQLKRELPSKVDPELVELTREQRDMLQCRVEFNRESGHALDTLLKELVATTPKSKPHTTAKRGWWLW